MHFPEHFIDSPVKVSCTAQEAFGRPKSYASLGARSKREWHSLVAGLWSRPAWDSNFHSLLERGAYDMDVFAGHLWQARRLRSWPPTLEKPHLVPASASLMPEPVTARPFV